MLAEPRQNFPEQSSVSHGLNFLKPRQNADHFDPESGLALRNASGGILKHAGLPHLSVQTSVRIQALHQK
jgi:hypothetical protein